MRNDMRQKVVMKEEKWSGRVCEMVRYKQNKHVADCPPAVPIQQLLSI
jgi:hypothetical protein